MTLRTSPYYITICAFLLLGASEPCSARDGGKRWVETASWEGHGEIRTRPFYIAGGKWRVKFYPDGKGPFSIDICNAAAETVGTAAVSSRVIPGWRTFSDSAGYRHLHIKGKNNTAWRVTVEQLMTVQEQWGLTQHQKKHRPVYRQVGVLAGNGREDVRRFVLTMQDNSWRVVVRNEDDKNLKMLLRTGEGETVMEGNLSKRGSIESWGYAPGDHVLEIEGVGSSWSVELFDAELSE